MKKVYNFNCINKLYMEIIGRNIIENGKMKKKIIMKKFMGIVFNVSRVLNWKDLFIIYILDVFVNVLIGFGFFFCCE